MLNKKKILISISILTIIFIIIPMSITVFLHNSHFDKRVVHQNNYYAFLSERNPDFMKSPATFTSNIGQELSGAFYYKNGITQPRALIVWLHGMSVNHENYLAEIDVLTNEGYLVFAYDSTGVSGSEGESLKGLTQAPIDLQYALNYLDTLDALDDYPCILIGHSWGGFAVASVSALAVDKKIDGIISLAGFWRNINVIEDIGKTYVGDFISLLVPYLSIYERILFGEDSTLDGIKGLQATDAPVLLLHSKDDLVVTYDANFVEYKKEFGDNPRFTFIEYEDAGHKLTITQKAYDRVHDIMHDQAKIDPNSEEFATIDAEKLTLIDDFNEAVMADILSFCYEISETHTR